MQYLQPMHISSSTKTMPSSRFWVAFVGHTVSHGGLLQCMQSRGRIMRLTFGYVPTSEISTLANVTPGGVAFSALQLVWQP